MTFGTLIRSKHVLDEVNGVGGGVDDEYGIGCMSSVTPFRCGTSGASQPVMPARIDGV
jgi:hypothetical protein